MRVAIKNKKIIFFLAFLGVFTLSTGALALEVDWPISPLGTNIEEALTPEGGLPKLVQYFYEWLIFLGGLATFIVLVIAGFQYLSSAGNTEKMRDAKSRIQSAGFGLILLLSSVLILNTINPQLTQLRMPSIEGISPGSLNITGEIKEMQPTFDSCEEIHVFSDPHLMGEIDESPFPVGTGFQDITPCGDRWCDIPIMSIKTTYTAEIKDEEENIVETEEKKGGMCQIELYGEYDCKENSFLTSIGGGVYEDLRTVVQSKTEEVLCIKVKQAGFQTSIPDL